MLHPVLAVIRYYDNGLAIPPVVVAQLRRTTVRAHFRESPSSYINILRLHITTTARDVLVAQELLLRGTRTDGRMGRRDDSYERRKLR